MTMQMVISKWYNEEMGRKFYCKNKIPKPPKNGKMIQIGKLLLLLFILPSTFSNPIDFAFEKQSFLVDPYIL